MDTIARTMVILKLPGFAGLLGCAFALGLAYAFVSPFLSLWGTQEVGMRPVVFSLFLTATSLSGIIVSTSLARWSDTHVPRKVMLLLGATGGVLGYAGYALVRDPWLLAGIGVTILALAAVNFSQLFAHTRERFAGAEIRGVPPGFLMSVVRVCFSLAWTAGPAVGAWLMAHAGFRGLFIGAAGLFLLFGLGVMRFVPFERQPPHARAAVRQPVWRVLTRGDIFAVFVAFLLIFAAHTINMLNLPLVLTQVIGGTAADVGIAFCVGPIVEIPLMLWFGLLAARGHQLALIRIAAASTVLYFLLLPLARAPWHVFVLQVFHGLSFAVIANVAIMFFQDLVPGQPGLATTVFSNSSHLGNLVGVLSFGRFLEAFSHRGMFLVSATFTLITLVIMLLYLPRATVRNR